MHSRQEAENVLQHLNAVHTSIKFELELPDSQGYVPFLDLKIAIEEDGRIKHKFYMKPANKGILIYVQSNHPRRMKTSTLNNEFRRMSTACSQDTLKAEATNLFYKKIRENGYTDFRKRTRIPRIPQSRRKTVYMTLPFISDAFSRKVKRLVSQSKLPIRIIDKPVNQLCHVLRKPTTTFPSCQKRNCLLNNQDCLKSKVVYQVDCSCQKTYIGMTTRPLHERIAEHRRAINNPHSYPQNAIGGHALAEHPNDPPQLQVSVISKLSNDLDCHIQEARYISERRPELNRREELTSIRGFLI